MTADRASEVGPGPGTRPDPWRSAPHDAWQEQAVVRALVRAQDAVLAALRQLPDAHGVDWSGGPAAGYRCELETVTDRLGATRSRLAAAVDAAERHAACVRRQGVTTLPAAPSWWPLPAGAPVAGPVGPGSGTG